MARAAIIAALITTCAVAWRTFSVAAQESVSQQTSAAVPSSVAERLKREVKTLESILPRAVDRGAVLFLLAHDYARLGEQAKALDLLKQCVALDEGFDPAGDKALAPLQRDPEFQNLIERVRQKTPPVHRAPVAFTIAQPDLFPEGLAVDPATRLFYMGSEYHNKIVRVSQAGEVTDLVKEGVYDLMPVGGVHVDPADHSCGVLPIRGRRIARRSPTSMHKESCWSAINRLQRGCTI